jgi:hypothetical protein
MLDCYVRVASDLEAVSMRSFLKNNGLSLALFGIFAVLLIAQSITGNTRYNEDRKAHDKPRVSFGDYLRSGHFLEAVGETWESEFLQMAAYVMFTVFLYQRGSAESKSPDGTEEVDREPNPNPEALGRYVKAGCPKNL